MYSKHKLNSAFHTSDVSNNEAVKHVFVQKPQTEVSTVPEVPSSCKTNSVSLKAIKSEILLLGNG